MLLIRKNTFLTYLFTPHGVLLCVTTLLTLLGVSFGVSSAISTELFRYGVFIGMLPVWFFILKDLSSGKFGVDIIAGLALIATLYTEYYLAGMVLLIMLYGGQFLEEYAMRRARHDLEHLLTRTPSHAHLVKEDGSYNDILAKKVNKNEKILIKSGEIIPCDGIVSHGTTQVDESALTGESIPVLKVEGSHVLAGTRNLEGSITILVTVPLAQSRFQEMIRLVQQAENTKAPIVRLADTYSIYFTLLTCAIALLTWVFTKDIVRIVAVLVVATPCPLLLATPIALMAGMGQASRKGIIVKNGGALETLASVDTFVFDKTGTLTIGSPEVSTIISFSKKYKEIDLLALTASLEQYSSHVFAHSILKKAQESTILYPKPSSYKELFGSGVSGKIGTTMYFIGKQSFIESSTKLFSKKALEVATKLQKESTPMLFVANEDSVLGIITFEDMPRKESASLIHSLRRLGVKKTILATGDQEKRAETIARHVGIHSVLSKCSPKDKLVEIASLQKSGNRVAMVGDGINDAPALAKADVGIAILGNEETASSDTASIIITSHALSKTKDVYAIAKQTLRIAKQGIFFGIGASTVAMVLGGFGYIPPLYGTLLQEGIDVVVILNALRLGKKIL